MNNGFERISKLYTNEEVLSSSDDLGLELHLDFKVYPNPIRSNILNISVDSSEGGFANIGIYDLQGRLLFQQSEMVGIGAQTISVNLPKMSPNSYFVQFENGKKRGGAKLIVQ